MSSTNVCWQAVSSTMRRKNGSIRFALSWLDYGKMFLSESTKPLQWKLNRHSNSFLDRSQSLVSQHFSEPKFTWPQCSGSMSLSSLSKRFLKSKNRLVWSKYSDEFHSKRLENSVINIGIAAQIRYHSKMKLVSVTEITIIVIIIKNILVLHPSRKDCSTLVTANCHENGKHRRRV